eukprot:1226364-Prymnesium_polylepis.2
MFDTFACNTKVCDTFACPAWPRGARYSTQPCSSVHSSTYRAGLKKLHNHKSANASSSYRELIVAEHQSCAWS